MASEIDAEAQACIARQITAVLRPAEIAEFGRLSGRKSRDAMGIAAEILAGAPSERNARPGASLGDLEGK